MKKQPLHLTIRQDIFNKIQNGTYEVGIIIPKEDDLAKKYNVSRPTIRQATQALVNEGQLERRQRRGTIVKHRKIRQDFAHLLSSYNTEMSKKHIHHKTTVLNFSQEKATTEISNALAIDEDDDVYKLVRLRYANEEPNVLVTTYLPAHPLKDFLTIDFTDESLYSVLEDLDLSVKQVSRTLEVIKANEITADLLNIDTNDPVFYFHTVGKTKLDLPIEYSIAWYRGDTNSFEFNITV